MEIQLSYKNKKINLEVRNCKYFFQKIRGLMFRRRGNAPALLLFDLKNPHRFKIHSLFVFFPFVAVWLDDKNNILEIKRINSWKFCILPKKKFCKLVEIPCNKRYKGILPILVED